MNTVLPYILHFFSFLGTYSHYYRYTVNLIEANSEQIATLHKMMCYILGNTTHALLL
jgi:hypothetical protein